MSFVATQPVEHRPDSEPGGLWERLDASRREVVELCGEKGKALFIFLLQSSTLLPEQDTIAVCPLQRLHDVAMQLGASPDTVKRYVAVFRALSLVSHYHDHRREVKLHIPLGSYCLLTNFTAFDELISKRQKQRQLALKVKARYITRFGDPTLLYSDEARTTFQELSTILEGEHLEPLKRQRLQMKLADLMSQLVRKSVPSLGDSNESFDYRQAALFIRKADLSCSEGDLNNELVVSCATQRREQEKEPSFTGDSNMLQGDSFSHSSASSHQRSIAPGDSVQQGGDLKRVSSNSSMSQPRQQGDSTPQQGDLKASSSIHSMLQPGQQGDSTPQEGDRISLSYVQTGVLPQRNGKMQGDSMTQEGDLLARQHTQQPDATSTKEPVGDSMLPNVPQKGDSMLPIATEVQVNAPYTYNVYYLINNLKGDNVIRKRLAQFLASVLEKSDYENGYPTFSKYLKAFKEYAPEVIGRAFLVTMVLIHRKHWQIERPGATFTDQCRILSGQKPLIHYTLDEVEEWLKTWGHLAYSELLVAVATQSESQTPEPASLITGSHKEAPKGRQYTVWKASEGRKRTYGSAYTGRPITVNKRIHNLSSFTQSSEKR